jgi:threonine/homoserine/homoserine lactone efflux protein
LGVVTILVTSEILFSLVKFLGAGYLVLLGLMALRDSFRPDKHASAIPFRRTSLRPFTACRQGFLSDMSNPKMAVFFASLLPQFVSPSEDAFVSAIYLGIMFSTMTFSWLSFYAYALSRAERAFSNSRLRKYAERATGTVLIWLGLALALERK